MKADPNFLVAVISRRYGQRVSRIERTFYEFDGELEEDDGQVQFLFDSSVLRFGGSGDGELITVSEEAWQDPFEGQMTPENAEFVRSHGRWRLVDVSQRPKYRSVIGKPLLRALPLVNRFGGTTGVQLVAGEVTMTIFVDGDEIHVSWE